MENKYILKGVLHIFENRHRGRIYREEDFISHLDAYGVSDSGVGKASYRHLELKDKIFFHHTWYNRFMARENLELAGNNLILEMEFRIKKLIKDYCS